MHWKQQLQYASISDIGFRRRNNQDSCLVQLCSEQETWRERGNLFLVADGMGGHAVGELASKIAVDTLPQAFFKCKEAGTGAALKHAIESTNGAIFQRGALNRDFERMGTTCTALVLSPRGAVIGHVGDSRVYRIRDSRIDQLSCDHSLQWELIKQGRLKPEEVMLHEPRHVITRSLGPEEAVEVDLEGPYPVLPGDHYLLCSDGLTGHVSDTEIAAIVDALDPGDACRLLVNLANLRGGSDNITVVIVRVGDLPAGVDAADVPRDDDSPTVTSWGWLAGAWVAAVAFAAGVSLCLLGRWPGGLSLSGIGLGVAALLLALWLRKRPGNRSLSFEAAETTLWKPYRSAVGKLNRRLIGHLAALEAELQRTASEEGWTLDWSVHETAYTAAKAALAQGRTRDAFRQFATAIDALMAGLHHLRKQLNHETKWGRGGSVSQQEESRT